MQVEWTTLLWFSDLVEQIFLFTVLLVEIAPPWRRLFWCGWCFNSNLIARIGKGGNSSSGCHGSFRGIAKIRLSSSEFSTNVTFIYY